MYTVKIERLLNSNTFRKCLHNFCMKTATVESQRDVVEFPDIDFNDSKLPAALHSPIRPFEYRVIPKQELHPDIQDHINEIIDIRNASRWETAFWGGMITSGFGVIGFILREAALYGGIIRGLVRHANG